MKKIIKGITYNTETGEKLFVINTETKTEWIHKEIFQKMERYGQKPMFFIYVYKWNECDTEIPELDRISEDIKSLSYKEVLALYEEEYGDRCNNNNTYNYIKELLDEESYMKNYKFTGATKVVNGVTLKQIECEKYGVGGWIESESNLAQEGDCWVYCGAEVYGKANVSGNAQVSGEAKVYGFAKVYDDAKVYGFANVYGRARVFGNAKVFDCAEVSCDAKVYDNAVVYGNAQVYGNAKVYDEAQVYDDAEVYGYAEVYGFSEIYGKANVFLTKKIS